MLSVDSCASIFHKPKSRPKACSSQTQISAHLSRQFSRAWRKTQLRGVKINKKKAPNSLSCDNNALGMARTDPLQHRSLIYANNICSAEDKVAATQPILCRKVYSTSRGINLPLAMAITRILLSRCCTRLDTVFRRSWWGGWRVGKDCSDLSRRQ